MEHQTPVQEVPVQETPPSVQAEEKKSSVFTKWWFWLIILALIIVAAFFVFQTTSDEEVTEEQETVPPTTEEFQQPEPEAFQETETVEEEFVSWGSLDIPAIFPEYNYGDIQEDFFGFSWSTGGVPNFLTIYNTTQDDIRMYVDEAVANGWELQWEEQVMGDEENSWSIYMETEETVYTALLEYHVDETEEYLLMILGEGTAFD